MELPFKLKYINKKDFLKSNIRLNVKLGKRVDYELTTMVGLEVMLKPLSPNEIPATGIEKYKIDSKLLVNRKLPIYRLVPVIEGVEDTGADLEYSYIIAKKSGVKFVENQFPIVCMIHIPLSNRDFRNIKIKNTNFDFTHWSYVKNNSEQQPESENNIKNQ